MFFEPNQMQIDTLLKIDTIYIAFMWHSFAELSPKQLKQIFLLVDVSAFFFQIHGLSKWYTFMVSELHQ